MVLDVELSVRMVSEDSTCTAAREVSSAAADSCSRQHRTAACGVRYNFQSFMQWSGNKERFCANQNTKESRRI